MQTKSLRPIRSLLHLLTGLTGVSAALALTGVLTARWLGPDERGTMLLITSIAASMTAVGSLGYSLEGRQRLSFGDSEQFIRRSLYRSIFSALLSGLTWVMYREVSDFPVSTFILLATAVLSFLLTMILILQNGLFGLGQFGRSSLILATGAFGQVFAICLLHWSGHLNLESVVVTILFVSGVVALLLIIQLERNRPIAQTTTPEPLQSPRGLFSRWAWCPPLITQFFLSWDRMLIGVVSTPATVAYFGVAATLSSLVLLFATTSGQLIQAVATDSLQLREIRKHVRSFLLLSLVCATLLFLFAPAVVTSIFGPEYADAEVPTRIMLVSVPVQIAIILRTSILLGQGKYVAASISGLVGIGMDVILIFLLVPDQGQIGASLAAFAAYSATLAMLLLLRLIQKKQ